MRWWCYISLGEEVREGGRETEEGRKVKGMVDTEKGGKAGQKHGKNKVAGGEVGKG